ncbi:putative rmlC-like cupin domain superfamily, rmlC-like jelly roll protein [Septoria linicola]|nr:putative rmlC-like cupin domain superfamily, rmlC-like jelly roll protein [Septoria linicola]
MPSSILTATRDLINGTSPSSAVWHDGPNTIPSQAGSPYFVAANWGPKFINNDTGSWQIVQPFVTPATGEHNFTQGTITLSRQDPNISIPTWQLADHTAVQVLEGSLTVNIGNESASLISGDVAFVPGGTPFQYYSMAAFTKFLYVAAGDQGLDQELLATAQAWDFPVFPTYNA